MFEKGTRLIMTKGYKGERGVIVDKTDSPYGFYIVKLDNGIQLAAGPTSFEVVKTSSSETS